MTGILAQITGAIPAPPIVTAFDVNGFASPPPNSQLVATGNTLATTVGGLGTISYLWTYVSGSVLPSPNSAVAANPFWSATIGLGITTAVWRVTATDELGRSSSFDITVTLELSN